MGTGPKASEAESRRRYPPQLGPAPTFAAVPFSWSSSATLDRAVDRCYRSQPFGTELQRLEFLFGLYQQLSAPVLGRARKTRRTEE